MHDILSHISRPNSKFPRKYCHDINPSNWEDLSPLFQELQEGEILNLSDLKQWIDARSELEAIIAEEGARLYINMTCYTDDADNAQLYTDFIQNIEPRVSPKIDLLNQKILTNPLIGQLDAKYGQWIKTLKAEVELFHEENVTIDSKIALQLQEYQQITGSMSCYFEGKIQNMSQMAVHLEGSDREQRELAWRASAEVRLTSKKQLNDKFNELFSNRIKMSKNSGHSSFLNYIFQVKGRFDYSIKECDDFARCVEKHVVPLARSINQNRKHLLKVDSLKPWDLACDPEGRPALKPFANSDELIAATYKIFNRVSPELGKLFESMKNQKLLDLDTRMGKAPGGYQCGLEESRLPFIFMNSVGTNSDLFTLLHETGHSFHQFFMAIQNLTAYRDINAEIAEVASMSMELIGGDFLTEIYDENTLKRVRKDHLEDVIKLLPWVATIDQFQIWMYSNPNHTETERTEKWLELDKRFGPEVDWQGLEEIQACSWQKQLHLFEVPFYYVEYGIAQIGALQMWKNYRENPAKALSDYQKGLSLGSSEALPNLFAASGIKFDFSEKTILPLIEMVKKELSLL
jgi:oligoendopeptidase F